LATPKDNEPGRKDLLEEAKRLLGQARPRVARAVDEAKPRIARAVEQAKPHVSRAVEQAKPIVEKGARESLQFVQDHEGELKQAGSMLLRSRVHGPLRFAVDAFVGGQAASAGRRTTPVTCPECDIANPASARFCSNCGSALPGSPDDNPGPASS
jgi:hypothetical protein